MSSIFGTSNDYFNSFFSYTSNINNGTSFLGGMSNMLGDYSMIKSGAYKKLLNSYYKTQSENVESSDKTDGEDTSSKKAAGTLLNVKSDAEDLKSAVDALNNPSLYKPTGKDENGKEVYDKDKIKETLQNFVDTYNSYIDSAGDVDDTSVLRTALNVVKRTSSNRGLLSEIGISVDKDNKLKLDEKKLSDAHLTTMSSLFEGYGSYGNNISRKASESYQLANSAAYTNKHGSSYTYSGAYSILGSSSSLLDKYL